MFEALEVSLQAVTALREPLRVIRSVDSNLYQQMRSAASSIPLNIGEARRRVGKDRKHLWRVAAGSAEEVRVALRTAIAWGDLEPRKADPSLELLDRVIAMLWVMTR